MQIMRGKEVAAILDKGTEKQKAAVNERLETARKGIEEPEMMET